MAKLHDMSAEIFAAALKELAALRTELTPLVEASFAEYCSERTEVGPDREPDESPVAYPGEGYECKITFGMIRRARAALAKVTANTPITGNIRTPHT